MQLPAGKHIGVRQRNNKLIVVIAYSRSKEQRSQSVQIQRQAGKEASPIVVQALLSCVSRANVSVVVEYGECITVLQRAKPFGGSFRIGEDMLSIIGLLLVIILWIIFRFIPLADNRRLHSFASIA